mmetsp:Transcript_14949/g.25544  ORF Transcript_14949/g.25544 Transcript_14949/m.25544 type:complete len:110 (-) Transcript_14949:898-1227(-)
MSDGLIRMDRFAKFDASIEHIVQRSLKAGNTGGSTNEYKISYIINGTCRIVHDFLDGINTPFEQSRIKLLKLGPIQGNIKVKVSNEGINLNLGRHATRQHTFGIFYGTS